MSSRWAPRAFAALGTLLAAACASPPGNVPDTYRESVRELLRLTGSGEIGEQMANATFRAVTTSLRQSNPELPPRAIAIAREVAAEEFGALFADEARLLDAFVPIYRKHFSKRELDELIAFYRTPLGTKVVHAMPAVVEESNQVGQRWAQEAMPRFAGELQRRLLEEGLIRGGRAP